MAPWERLPSTLVVTAAAVPARVVLLTGIGDGQIGSQDWAPDRFEPRPIRGGLPCDHATPEPLSRLALLAAAVPSLQPVLQTIGLQLGHNVVCRVREGESSAGEVVCGAAANDVRVLDDEIEQHALPLVLRTTVVLEAPIIAVPDRPFVIVQHAVVEHGPIAPPRVTRVQSHERLDPFHQPHAAVAAAGGTGAHCVCIVLVRGADRLPRRDRPVVSALPHGGRCP